MTKAKLISKIDEVLEKHQFRRNGLRWNRDCSDFVDVVDLQVSKSKDMFAINLGIAEKFVIRACWGIDDFATVEEQSCTVRARLGELLHGRDVWWPLPGSDDIAEILIGIQDLAMPFLQLNHSVDQMIDALESDPVSVRYPPGVIYLALLHHRKGECERAREMFKSMKLTGAWSQKASGILDALV